MTIEEKFKDYDARIRAAGIAAQPCDYFKAGYLFGGAAQITRRSEMAAPKTDELRNALDDAIEIIKELARCWHNGIIPELETRVINKLRGALERES